MPDPPEALRVASRLCKKNAPIYITQTFQLKPSPVMSVVKPLLKYLTTIDFGQLTTLERLDSIINEAGFRVERNVVIKDSVQNRWQSTRLVVAVPK